MGDGSAAMGREAIKGIGVDIIEVDRIRELVERKADRLEGRVFTRAELEACGNGHYDKLAGRFAAKEAVSKALGTGVSGIGWDEIEIVEDASGKPCARLTGRAAHLASRLGVAAVEVSIAHTAALAVAFAVAVGGVGSEDRDF